MTQLKQITKIFGLAAVAALALQAAHAEEVGGAFRRADQVFNRYDWPKIDGKAILAYWPQDRINGGDLNWAAGPNADKFCRSLGFAGQAGYQVYDVYQSEWDVGLNDERGGRTDYYMQPVYDYYRGLVPFGTFQSISCQDNDRYSPGRPDVGYPGSGPERRDPGYGRHR